MRDVEHLRKFDQSRPDHKENPLFPCCRNLICELREDEDFADLGFLISPRLKELSLSVGDLEPVWFGDLCDTLISRLSNLHLLSIAITCPSPETVQCLGSFTKLLTCFASTLAVVRIPELFVTSLTLAQLSNLPELCDFSVNYSEFAWVDFPASSTEKERFVDFSGNYNSAGFASLESMALYTIPRSFVNDVFSLFKFTALTILQLTVSDDFKSHMDGFFQAVVECCPELQALDVSGSSGSLHQTLIPWSFIQPLLSCRHLSMLSLPTFQVDMEFEEYIQLITDRPASTNWRSLEVFTVKPFHIQDVLPLLAQHCPLLQILGIHAHSRGGFDPSLLTPVFPPVDPTVDPVSSEIQVRLQTLTGQKFSFPFLTSIDFYHSKFAFNSAWPVASFILSISQETPFVTGWDIAFWFEVTSHMEMYHKAREAVVGIPMPSHIKHMENMLCLHWLHLRDDIGWESQEQDETGSDEGSMF